MTNRDQNRMDFLALKIKSGVPLTPEEQAQWDADAHLGDKVKAGLPLTPEERERVQRANEATATVRTGGIVMVEAPPMTVDDWKALVQRERAAGGWLPKDGVDKRET